MAADRIFLCETGETAEIAYHDTAKLPVREEGLFYVTQQQGQIL